MWLWIFFRAKSMLVTFWRFWWRSPTSLVPPKCQLVIRSWIILAKTKSWNSGGHPDAHGGICAPHINTWNQNRMHSVENENNGGHPSSSILPSLISSKLYFNFSPIPKWNSKEKNIKLGASSRWSSSLCCPRTKWPSGRLTPLYYYNELV